MAFCLAIVRYLYTITNSPAYFTYQATVSNLALIILFVAIAFLIHFRHYRIATITSFALAPLLLTISGILTREMMSSLPGVNNEVDKSAVLMENLLIWARNQLHESNIIFQHLELSRIVENTLRLFSKKAAEKGIELINNVPPDTTVYADADMTKAILRNLTDNAIKFTNPGGYIEVSIENSNAHIKLIVKDNGVGISEEGITKIFGERYYTTLGTEKESGTGLGLMICRDFIASNNGDFDILSKQGEGSSFIITFPEFKEE